MLLPAQDFFSTYFSLTELIVSHDLLRSTVTNQATFNQRDLRSISNLERAMDRC